MQQQGWVKLHRKLLDSELWNDVTTYRLFTYLILSASHQDGTKINGVAVNRGQWIRSYRKLAEDLSYKEGRGLKQYSIHTIKKCVDKLVKSQRVSILETEVGTLFTIVNYAFYQGFEDVNSETVNGSGNELGTKWEQKQELKNAKKKDIAEIEKFRNQFSLEIQNLIDPYWEVVSKTRKTGKISESVIAKTMQQWTKFDSHVVHYSLKKHLESYDDGDHNEKYTLGIMRNTSPEQAADLLNKKHRSSTKIDPRDKEIAFQQWITEGNSPEDFNWED